MKLYRFNLQVCFLFSAFIVTLAILSLSCKGGESGDEPRLLLGEWRGACLQNYEFFYTRRSLVFESNRKLKHKREIFSDDSCLPENAVGKVEYIGRYEYAVTFKPYVYKLDMWVDSSSVSIADKILLELVNRKNACGFNEWELGKSYQLNLLDEGCPADLWATSYRSTYIKLKRNQLAFASLFETKPSDIVSLENPEIRYLFSRLN